MSGFFASLGGAEAAAQSVASALIAGVWQSALLVAGVGMVLKAVPRTTAAVRFAIWTAVFCVSGAMPLAGVFFGSRGGMAVGSLQVDPRWSYAIAVTWMIAVAVRMVQLAMQGWKLRALWKGALPVADEALAVLGCGDLLAERRVRICTSEDVDRPSVIGFFAPRILIPAWLFHQLSAIELRHIVLHEMEHLRRRDDWMNLVQKIGLVVFPFNPALFWVDRRLAAERELACDDGVLRQTRMPRAYASCLASIAEIRLERKLHRRVMALALGIFGAVRVLRGRSEFSRRIESILSRRTAVNPELAGAIAAVLVVMVVVAGLGLARAPRLVSFGPVSRAQGLAATRGTDAARRVTESGGLVAGAGVEQVSFHLPRVEGSATLAMGRESVPQRLKPHGKRGVYGTAEAVPLSKTAFTVAGAGVPIGKTGLSGAGAAVPTIKAGDSAYRDVRSSVRPAIKTKLVVKEQWMVLTAFSEDSADEDAPARVVVRLADGRFYVVPYAAVPVRDGWLIVQL